MLIVDAHLDLAWNACEWGRDLRRPVAELRAAEAGLDGAGRGGGTVALPELRAARVAVAVATLLSRSTGVPVAGLDHATVEDAAVAARRQLEWYRALESAGELVVIETAGQLERHVARWRGWEAGREPDVPPLGVVLGFEGADPIAAPADLGRWHRDGLRVVGLAHYGPGRYAGGTTTRTGLTDLGRRLLAELRSLALPLDLTHLTDAGIAEALALHEGPVLASHANARALVEHDRQLTDAQILAIAERGGVIGVALDCWMLDETWVRGQADNPVRLGWAVDHVDHVCQLTGSAAHVGIGSDLDGGFGREQSPADLDTVADVARLAGLLRERGYAEADVGAIMHGNWLRFLGGCLPH